MIEARHTLSGKWLADLCSGPYMDRFFRQVSIEGCSEDGNYPLLMFANHFSWWDGFIQYRLNREVFGRRLHVMMLEEQLLKHRIMNRCGCFSVRKNSRSMINSMKYAAGLMNDPENSVLIFPQGEIGSLYNGRINFQAGALYLMKHIGVDYRIIFNVNLIDYGSFKKPTLKICHKAVNPAPFLTLQELENGYDRYYKECLEAQCSKVW